MEFFETVKTRYSYREAFLNEAIPEGDLNKILEAGCLAPTGYNMQTTEIVVCKKDDLKNKIGDIFDHEGMRTAPVVLVMVSSLKKADGLSFEIQDYASVTEHICLAATALGYATVWTDGDTGLDGRNKQVAQLLHIPEEKTVRAVLPIGIAKTPGAPAEKKSIDELVYYDQYDGKR